MRRQMRHIKYLTIVVVVVLDQLTKFIVRETMQIGDSINLLGDFFKLTRVANEGGAMNSFEGSMFMLIAIPVLAMVVAIWYMEKHPEAHWTLPLSLELIISGGLGNLIDRLTLHSVTDFLDFTAIPGWNWVFNVADIAVCVGCALLVLYVIKFDNSASEAKHIES